MDPTGRCVFRPCPNPAIVTLRLFVDERETVLTTVKSRGVVYVVRVIRRCLVRR